METKLTDVNESAAAALLNSDDSNYSESEESVKTVDQETVTEKTSNGDSLENPTGEDSNQNTSEKAGVNGEAVEAEIHSEDQITENQGEGNNNEDQPYSIPSTQPPSPKRSKTTKTKQSQTSGDQTLTKSQFVDMMTGKHQPRPKTTLGTRKSYGNKSSLHQSQISDVVDKLLQGNQRSLRNINDPDSFSEVIDELNLRRIDAMSRTDYKEAKHIKDTISEVRRLYRINGRQEMFEAQKADAEARYKEAEEQYNQAKEKEKEKIQELKQKQKEEFQLLHDKFIQQHEEFDEKWSSPEKTREFSHRSSFALQQKAIEKFLFITENYDAADSQRKYNLQLEKQEIIDAQMKMHSKYEEERSILLIQQYEAVEKLKHEQEVEFQIAETNEKKIIDVHKKRLDFLAQKLEEAQDINKFTAKVYKTTKENVKPVTVCINGGDDLPALSKGRVIPLGADKIREMKSKKVIDPLPLPPLKKRSLRLPRNLRSSM